MIIDRYQEKLHRIQNIRAAEAGTVDGEESDDDDNVGVLCCSFHEYLECSMLVVNTTCGRETAVFTKQFLDRMATPLNQVSNIALVVFSFSFLPDCCY